MMSIIIPSLNEGKQVETTVHNIRSTVDLKQYEIVVVDSGGTVLSAIEGLPEVKVYESEREGAPQARNLGASKANGDILVFADAHVQFHNGWGERMLESSKKVNGIVTPSIAVLGDESSRGAGFVWKNIHMDIAWLPDSGSMIHDIPFACSACIAVPKKVFNDVGGFDSGTRYWGSEDSELSMRAWLFGYEVVCDPSIRVSHAFKEEHPYHIAWFDELYNKARFAFSHFSVKRLESFLRGNTNVPMMLDVLLEIQKSNVFTRRSKLFKRRVKSDDWFFQRFQMSGWSS
jgi:glycosyltransferase involved in cell wall biosynthesis